MKSKAAEKTKKEFDTVAFFRNVKKRISKKIYGKSLEEIQDYFKERKLNTTDE